MASAGYARRPQGLPAEQGGKRLALGREYSLADFYQLALTGQKPD
jgi:hypothetical protein